MKSYQKPSLKVVEYELNEAVASCSSELGDNLFNDSSCSLSELGQWYLQLGINFTSDTNCDSPTYDYCYYTSTSENTSGILASS